MSDPFFQKKTGKCLNNKQKAINNFEANSVCLFTSNILSLTMVFKCQAFYETDINKLLHVCCTYIYNDVHNHCKNIETNNGLA